MRSIPWRVVFPVSFGTGLSLLGDSALYTVLPINLSVVGITLGALGIILSANRFIRIILNTPVGLLYDRSARKAIFLLSLYLGALSTAIYGLTSGFVPLLIGRLLWGIAWTGIWVGGNLIILDVSTLVQRGRLVGIYQGAFFLGAAAGAILGGVLTDLLGYHQAMLLFAGLTFTGALVATILLPETRALKLPGPNPDEDQDQVVDSPPQRRGELVSANALLGVNRLAVAGVVPATFALYLQEQFGTNPAGFTAELGVASLAGVGLGVVTITSMFAAPFAGRLSDRVHTRWIVVGSGLALGVAGFLLLASGFPRWIAIGLLLIAASSGSNTSQSTTLVGDLSAGDRRGKSLGILYTVGDLGSALGPLLVFSVFAFLPLNGVYTTVAGVLGVMFLVALIWVVKRRRPRYEEEIGS